MISLYFYYVMNCNYVIKQDSDSHSLLTFKMSFIPSFLGLIFSK